MSAAAMNHRVDTCPDLETVAAFIDGRLDEPTREAIAAHLASCDACYFLLAEAAHVQPAAVVPSPPPVQWWRRPAAAWSFATVAAAAALVLAVRTNPGSTPANEPLRQLVVAVGTERLIEPRLTGGFAYGPIRTVRSEPAAVAVVSPEVRIAAAMVDKLTIEQTDAAARHARGVAALVVGDVDAAVSALELAARAQPVDARVLSDLAAAYLVRARQGSDPNDLRAALAVLNRAVEADRLLTEARFNRAYALERLGMTTEAREAWTEYLTLDNRSPWADEARLRLAALERPQ